MTEDKIVYAAGGKTPLHTRFRGFLPVVVDVETGGFNCQTDALLEVAAVIISQDEQGKLCPEPVVSTHVIPFEGANMDPKSMEVNGIDPYHPLRAARKEQDALGHIFTPIRKAVKESGCNRAILVGHNAFYGQTVLARAAQTADLGWSTADAHSAVYDTEMTARLFCTVINRWEELHQQA